MIDKLVNNIKKINGNSPDFVYRKFNINNKDIAYIYLESVTSDDKVSDFLVKSLVNIKNGKKIGNSIYNSKINYSRDFNKINYYLTSGFTILLFSSRKYIYIETKEILDRGVVNATGEVTLRGSKDSFTENYNKNIGLIRKRIKDKNLRFSESIVGVRTETKVSVSYIKDVAKNVKGIIDKINSINIDGILDVGYIRDFLTDDTRSFFPTVITTERPDLACASLLEGKIVIIVENCPFVLVIPGFFGDYLHSAEDNYQKSINSTVTRFIRCLAFLTTIMVPSLYVAITTFNQEIIPDTLLVTLAIQRSTVPFPTSFAVFILMITFEILREADIRMPTNMGTSIGIVGALVLGDAAVNAGIVSPIVVIVVAISAITGLLFTDIDFVNALRFWKFIFLFASTIMGLIGFFVVLLIFITKLCSMEVMGISYLEPFSPLNISALKDVIFTVPRNKMKTRPDYLSDNTIRLGDNNEK